LRHSGIRTQIVIVIANAGNGAVKLLQIFIVKPCIRYRQLTGIFIDGQTPQALQEALRAHDILGCHGRDVSNGPMDISYTRRVSAPNSAQKSSGPIAFFNDLPILPYSWLTCSPL